MYVLRTWKIISIFFWYCSQFRIWIFHSWKTAHWKIWMDGITSETFGSWLNFYIHSIWRLDLTWYMDGWNPDGSLWIIAQFVQLAMVFDSWMNRYVCIILPKCMLFKNMKNKIICLILQPVSELDFSFLEDASSVYTHVWTDSWAKPLDHGSILTSTVFDS